MSRTMARRRYGAFFVLALATFAGNGCTVARIQGHGSLPVLLNNPPAETELIERVRIRKRIAFDYTRTIDVSAILVQHITGERFRNADAIVNVAVVWKTTPLDVFLNIVTFTFAASQTIEVTGDIVRFIQPGERRPEEAPPPPRPPPGY